MGSIDKVRNALMRRARKEIAKYDREFEKAGGGEFPEIIPRSEAIMRVREEFMYTLIRPDADGFDIRGFKGVENMTNKELSERLSSEPPTLNCMVWDDAHFQVLFGDRRRANENVLGKMGLYHYPFCNEPEFQDGTE